MTTSQPTWVKLSTAAYDVDLSVRQLQQYAKRPECPRKSDGKGGWLYEWPAFNRFVREEAKRDAARGDAPDDLDEARLRKLGAEAEIAEMERDQMRGTLVPVADVAAHWGDMFSRINSKLVQAKARLVDRLVGGPTTRKHLQPIVNEVVEEIRTELREGEDIPDADSLEETSTEEPT